MRITFRTHLFWMVFIMRVVVKAQFLPGHLVVLQVGDGIGTFTNTGNPVFCDRLVHKAPLRFLLHFRLLAIRHWC